MTGLKRTDRSRMRALNTQLVLDCIRAKETTSQADLIKATHLNTGTIVSIVGELCRRKLVVQAGQGASRGGRPPTLLRLNNAAAAVMSCRVESDTALIAVLDLDAHVLASRTVSIDRERGPNAFLAKLASNLKTLQRRHKLTGSDVVGLGLSLHGPVDVKRGMMIFSDHLGWQNVPFRDELQRKLGLPVFVDNETRAMTLAEQCWGAARGMRDFVLIELDTGIGMVQVINGVFARGRHHLAGEMGFTLSQTTMHAQDNKKPRTLEDVASLRSLCLQAQRLPELAIADTVSPDSSETAEEIWLRRLVALSQDGNKSARGIVEQTILALSVSIANVIHLLDPELVLLAGRLVSGADGALVDPLIDRIRQYLIGSHDYAPRITCTSLGGDAALRGAARLAIDDFLSADKLEK